MIWTLVIQFLTCWGAIVGDEAGHVYGLAVDSQVPNAAHKVSVLYGEILREVWNATQEQRSGKIQWPAHKKIPEATNTQTVPNILHYME